MKAEQDGRTFAGAGQSHEQIRHHKPDPNALAVIDCGYLDWKCYMVLRDVGEPHRFVTHWFNSEDGGYYHGHYFTNYEEAVSDLCERVKPNVIRELKERLRAGVQASRPLADMDPDEVDWDATQALKKWTDETAEFLVAF